jgi:hypothetical protein
MTFLVGDNPFHGISHLSQERSRARGNVVTDPEYAANLVITSLENGADGFMFSVSDKTLSILRIIREQRKDRPLSLYALAPYAYEYVRLATQLGGISGLAKRFAKQIILSGNVRAIAMGIKGIVGADLIAIMKAYLSYEISRIKSSAGRQGNLDLVFLHEVITDMALGLNSDQLFKSYIEFMLRLGLKAGFETRNFPYLVSRFKEWNVDFNEIVVATPFNKVGFQMNPSKIECEKALAVLPESSVIAMSVLGAGYLRPEEAIGYLQGLPNLKGVVVGVSKEDHARKIFKLLEDSLVLHS